MTAAPHPNGHHIELVQTTTGYTRYTCYLCDQSGDFAVTAYNGDPITYAPDTCEDATAALARIRDHLYPQQLKPAPAYIVEAAEALAAERGDIGPSVRLLATYRKDIALTVHDERLEARDR